MAIVRKIEIDTIKFIDEQHGPNISRVAHVLWRISLPGSDQEFTIPMAFFVNEEVPEEQIVANAKAALHALTQDLADQTKGWALP